MQESHDGHLLSDELLPFIREFLKGGTIRNKRGELISNASTAYGKTYFAAYPEYMNDFDGHKRKVDRMMQLLQGLGLKPQPGAEVAVIGCGHGTHDAFLARDYGLHVSGIDITEEAIEFAREKAAKEHLAIDYAWADATLGLPFKRESMSAAFCLGTSWGFDPEDQRNQATFTHIYEILQSGGVFVLDYVNGQKWVQLEGMRYKQKDTLDNGAIRTVEGEYYANQTAQVTKVTLELPGKEPSFYYEYVKYYTVEIVISMLKDAGFTIQRVCGDMDGQDFDAQTSDQMVIIATK